MQVIIISLLRVQTNKKRLLMKTMWPNKSLNSDAQKRRFAMLLHAG